MAGLNLQQIEEYLNKQFADHDASNRKLIFWYDAKQDFMDELSDLHLEKAKIYQLQPKRTFGDKYYLTIQHPVENFLVYAPFSRPEPGENHLEDMLHYSEIFRANKSLLILQELGLGQEMQPVIEKYQEFFNSKDRRKKFILLGMENPTEQRIALGILSVLSGAETADYGEVLRGVLRADVESDKNVILEQFAKFNVLEDFWNFANDGFGYYETNLSVRGFLIYLFINGVAQSVEDDLPESWQQRINRSKGGSIATFLSGFMYNMLCAESYKKIAAAMERELQVREVLGKISVDKLLAAQIFPCIDSIIIEWIREELNQEDITVQLKGKNIEEICSERSTTYFGKDHANTYMMFKQAFAILKAVNYVCPNSLDKVVKQYVEKDYLLDRCYRDFYYYYDKIETRDSYQQLREKVENIYTNLYLGQQLVRWNQGMLSGDDSFLLLQRDFYRRKLVNEKSKTVVIISDGMRYEVGQELYERFKDDERCMPQLEYMLSTLPSYTPLGMAVLLPHDALDMTDKCEYLCDGMSTAGTPAREKILQKHRTRSVAVAFKDIAGKKTEDLRNILTGQEIIYVYHNQIDATGETVVSEQQVFEACAKTIDDIYKLVHYIGTNGNTYHFFITSDHGFLYKRDKLTEADKIAVPNSKNRNQQDRRFVIDRKAIVGDGIGHKSMGKILQNKDERIVSFPLSSNVFKTGGGMNYVHGGSSPQEMLVPLLEIKMEKGHMDAYKATVELISTMNKITNNSFYLDFVQKDPVGENIKEANYMAYFIGDGNERISDLVEIVANSREQDSSKRLIRKKFTLKQQAYSRAGRYYLIVQENNAIKESNREIMRREFTIDLAFSGNFDF